MRNPLLRCLSPLLFTACQTGLPGVADVDAPDTDFGSVDLPDEEEVIAPPERTADSGRVTARRLNRNEYNNTVRDLFSTALTPADDFPDDDFSGGWDNQADALSLSPLHLEMYEQAAQELIDIELATPIIDSQEWYIEAEADAVTATTGRAGTETYNLWSNGSLYTDVTVPAAGTYRLQARMYGAQAGPDDAQASLDIDGIARATVDVAATSAAPEIYSVEVELEAGTHSIGVSFLNDYHRPDQGLDRNLLVDWVSLEGPYGASTEPSAARSRYFTCDPAVAGESECAETVLMNFTTQAWRRPATSEDVAWLMTLYDLSRTSGGGWEEAVKLGIQAALLSPRFVFRLEIDAAPEAAEARLLDGYELASRLSYFLWASMPDEELFSKAADGSLLEDAELETQVRRMLADPRAQSLVDHFAGQWLKIRAVDEVEPDYQLFPDFDEELKTSMKTEMELFVEGILLSDRSMMDLLTAEETYVDRRLGEHYGLTIEADGFVPAVVTDHRRAGLLGKAGLLTALAYPTRTSPVKRGQWVMANLLCEAPPPAPAAVEGLPESGEATSLREQMEQHREDPSCATCHRVMDPIGFSMENFDPTGAWRTTDDFGFEVEAAGTWPGGPVFEDMVDLSAALAEDDKVAFCMTQKAFAYGLGRPAGVEDLVYIDQITEQFINGGHRFADLAVAIVTSETFRRRRGEPQGE
ncbi:MAG: DUF1592 domain-containing protein [Myxococcota bacterium]